MPRVNNYSDKVRSCLYFIYIPSPITSVLSTWYFMLRCEVPSTSNTYDWAGYIDRIKTRPDLITVIIVKYLPNRLTPLYSEIHYEEENYLKARTAVFKYITPPHNKGSVRRYVGTSRSHVLSSVM